MNIVKRMMQRAVVALLFIAAVTVAAQKAMAYTVDRPAEIVAAGADFSNITPTVSLFDTIVKSISNNAVVNTGLSWSGVAPGQSIWKAADQYIEVQSQSTFPGWGVQIYTNNKAPTANPQYKGQGNPAGLVGVVNSSSTMPLAWRVLENTTSYATVNNPTPRPDGSGWQNFDYKYVLDAGSPGYVPGADYQTVAGEKGIHFGEGPADWGARADSIQYVYLISNFQTATAQAYRTSTLTLEIFHP